MVLPWMPESKSRYEMLVPFAPLAGTSYATLWAKAISENAFRIGNEVTP
jgi:hypothetical protein